MIRRGRARANSAATAGSSSRSMPCAMPAGGRRVIALQNAVISEALPARRIDHPSIEVAPNKSTSRMWPRV
jgi:hypothetical protein